MQPPARWLCLVIHPLVKRQVFRSAMTNSAYRTLSPGMHLFFETSQDRLRDVTTDQFFDLKSRRTEVGSPGIKYAYHDQTTISYFVKANTSSIQVSSHPLTTLWSTASSLKSILKMTRPFHSVQRKNLGDLSAHSPCGKKLRDALTVLDRTCSSRRRSGQFQ